VNGIHEMRRWFDEQGQRDALKCIGTWHRDRLLTPKMTSGWCRADTAALLTVECCSSSAWRRTASPAAEETCALSDRVEVQKAATCRCNAVTGRSARAVAALAGAPLSSAADEARAPTAAWTLTCCPVQAREREARMLIPMAKRAAKVHTRESVQVVRPGGCARFKIGVPMGKFSTRGATD